MKIKFPIACDRDYEALLAIMAPDLFCIEYASCVEAKELYYSLTEQEKEEIKEYVTNYKK